MDCILFIAAGSIISGFVGWFFGTKRRPAPQQPPAEEIITTTYQPAPLPEEAPISPDRIVVAFDFKDGTREIKRLFKHSCTPSILWRGKTFTMHSSSDDVHLYYFED